MEVPNDYKNAGLMTLIGGALNAITAFFWVIGFIWLCVGVLWVVPLAMGIYQVVVGIAMQNGQPHAHAKLAPILGIVAGVFNFNPFPIVLGIISLMQVGKPEVAGWIEQNPS